ncbi:MAG: hypothetical protein K6T81_17635 [Alicyclobacillus macrosporangiidus]|nr:hypothetical protein [Alicyclobacillus macrosporangiidus]
MIWFVGVNGAGLFVGRGAVVHSIGPASTISYAYGLLVRLMSRITSTDRSWIRASEAKVNGKWLREHLAHDVTRDLPKVCCPVLAIGGTKDVQVMPEDARRVAEIVAGPAEWHIIQDMTHAAPDDGPHQHVTLTKLYQSAIFKAECPIGVHSVAFSSIQTAKDMWFLQYGIWRSGVHESRWPVATGL